eukprot:g45801.t1
MYIVANLANYCFTDLEYLTVKCRPYPQPREFTILTTVYIPPQAEVTNALDEIYNALETKFPEALVIVACDFKQANFNRVLPKYHQYISCPTRGLNILDHGYTTIKDAYRSIPPPTLREIRPQRCVPAPSLQAEVETRRFFTKSGLRQRKSFSGTTWNHWTICKLSVGNPIHKYTTTVTASFARRKEENTHPSTSTEVERVDSIKFLGETITNNLSWTSYIDVMVKTAQQRLFFLTQLKNFSMSIRTLTNFYRCTILS